MSVWTLNCLYNKCIFILWSSLEENKKLICWSAVTAHHILGNCIRMLDGNGNIWVNSANLQKFNTIAWRWALLFSMPTGRQGNGCIKKSWCKSVNQLYLPQRSCVKWASTVFSWLFNLCVIGLWDRQRCENEIQHQNATVSKDFQNKTHFEVRRFCCPSASRAEAKSSQCQLCFQQLRAANTSCQRFCCWWLVSAAKLLSVRWRYGDLSWPASTKGIERLMLVLWRKM